MYKTQFRAKNVITEMLEMKDAGNNKEPIRSILPSNQSLCYSKIILFLFLNQILRSNSESKFLLNKKFHFICKFEIIKLKSMSDSK